MTIESSSYSHAQRYIKLVHDVKWIDSSVHDDKHKNMGSPLYNNNCVKMIQPRVSS